jgi:peptidyl-prolyl cis-trans isomerase A (cyclophilin A)
VHVRAQAGRRGAGFAALGAVALASAGCVFHPPPPLPEELAAKEAKEAEHKARLAAGKAAKPDAEGKEGPRFQPGDEPELGMSDEEIRQYATAQGDPEGGAFTLDEALAGLPGAESAPLWVRMTTTGGIIECELTPAQTPITVANFVGLARGLRPFRDADTSEWVKKPFYDGTKFHRVIPGFMIQGGDPTGTGRGDSGYVIPDEIVPELRHDRAGQLSMANRGPTTGSSQFFVTLAPTPHLDEKHTVFGRCTDESVKVAEAIAATAGEGDQPSTPQLIEKLEIVR